jgi:ATP-dependent helicase/DNAse subunit B
MNGLNIPRVIGSTKRWTPTQLAESTIEIIGEHKRYGKNKAVLFYAVCLDLAGRVVMDRLDDAPPSEIVMACSYKSDPDDLADALRHELQERAA